MPTTPEQVRQLRDAKVREVLREVAPVWLVKDEYRPREDSLLFNLVFQDPSYGWMNRRYKYDAFNDVLYHLGWRLLTEEETLSVQETEPYIPGDVAVHVPNAPAHRLSGSAPHPR